MSVTWNTEICLLVNQLTEQIEFVGIKCSGMTPHTISKMSEKQNGPNNWEDPLKFLKQIWQMTCFSCLS